jgi:hypothetical protein
MPLLSSARAGKGPQPRPLDSRGARALSAGPGFIGQVVFSMERGRRAREGGGVSDVSVQPPGRVLQSCHRGVGNWTKPRVGITSLSRGRARSLQSEFVARTAERCEERERSQWLRSGESTGLSSPPFFSPSSPSLLSHARTHSTQSTTPRPPPLLLPLHPTRAASAAN